MKKILVSQRLVEQPDYKEIRETLDVEWGRFLPLCGLLPVPVSASIDAETYYQYLRPDGILLTGGNDLHSVQPNDPMNALRDRVETGLIQLAVRHKLPLIGVCRGMQMVGAYFGASLTQVSNHVAVKHKIKIADEGAFYGCYPDGLSVNSFHKYGFQTLPEELTVVAKTAEDDTVEAFRHKQLNVYAMMWHPERCSPFSKHDSSFFKRVFNIQEKY